MNIYEVSAQFNISITKLRKLDKAGLLRLDASDPLIDAMRFYLAKGKPLTVAQLVALVETPALIEYIGDRAGAALAQVAMLGSPVAAPLEIAAEIDQASRGDMSAVERLLPYLKSQISEAAAQGQASVNHHYLAVRLAMGSSANMRSFVLSRVARALLNCRRHPDFAGWSRIMRQGTVSASEYGNFDGNIPFDL